MLTLHEVINRNITKKLAGPITDCVHVTVSKKGVSRSRVIYPVTAADRSSSFTGFNLCTGIGRQLGNRAEGHWKSNVSH